MRCDTCRREVPEVSRVVIYTGYNKAAAKAIYNCPECFAKKEKTKLYNKPAKDIGGSANTCGGEKKSDAR